MELNEDDWQRLEAVGRFRLAEPLRRRAAAAINHLAFFGIVRALPGNQSQFAKALFIEVMRDVFLAAGGEARDLTRFCVVAATIAKVGMSDVTVRRQLRKVRSRNDGPQIP